MTLESHRWADTRSLQEGFKQPLSVTGPFFWSSVSVATALAVVISWYVCSKVWKGETVMTPEFWTQHEQLLYQGLSLGWLGCWECLGVIIEKWGSGGNFFYLLFLPQQAVSLCFMGKCSGEERVFRAVWNGLIKKSLPATHWLVFYEPDEGRDTQFCWTL